MSYEGRISQETVLQIRLSLELDLNETLCSEKSIPNELCQYVRRTLEQDIAKGASRNEPL